MSYSETVFFIPIRFNDFDFFTTEISKNNLWENTQPEKYTPRYFLNYVLNIAKNNTIFRSFSLRDISDLNIYMYEDRFSFEVPPQITDVRLSCFSTGVGFLEFWVKYYDMKPEEISNFAYCFKKAAPTRAIPENGKLSLFHFSEKLLSTSSDVKLFFTAATKFKYECQCYHFIHIDGEINEETADKSLFLLKRSYHSNFTKSNESDYDMIYKPFFDDHWGGSCEGLVNITYDTKCDETDRYLHEYKYSHLCVDYYFMYLILLNQRFACIQYITQISTALSGTQKEIEILNQKIVELKTTFSFNVISDDQIFQNVYSKMYKILDINSLLEDILDNEGQIQILRHSSVIKAEKLSSKFLFGISLLSIFSALIDAASFFDRFQKLSAFSTALGLISTSSVALFCIIWAIIKMKNEK